MKIDLFERDGKILKYQKNLYMIFLISMLVPVAILIIGIMFYSNYVLDRREELIMENMVESVSRNIEMQIQDVIDIGNLFYTDQEVFQEAEYLNNPNLYQYYDALTRSKMETDYSRTLSQAIYTASQTVRSVVFFPMNEMSWTAFYLGRERASIREFPYSGYHSEEWFTEAADHPGNTIVYSVHNPDYFKKGEKKQVYSCVSAIRDMNNGKIIGVVKIDVDPENLQESMDVVQGKDKQGFILLREEEMLLCSEGFLGEERLESGKYIKRSRKIPRTDLELMYLYSRSSYYRGLLVILMFSMLIIGGSIYLAFEVYRRKMQKMVDDVRVITDVVAQTGNGNLENRIHISPPLSILVSLYSVLVDIGGINHYWGVILTLLTFELPMAIFLYTNFITSIPEALDEAAAIDGCGPVRTFFMIILPQLKSVTASVVILTGIHCWNDYQFSLYVLQSSEKRTVILAISSFFSQTTSNLNAASAAALLAILPVVICFLCLQKYFIKGMVDSAVK